MDNLELRRKLQQAKQRTKIGDPIVAYEPDNNPVRIMNKFESGSIDFLMNPLSLSESEQQLYEDLTPEGYIISNEPISGPLGDWYRKSHETIAKYCPEIINYTGSSWSVTIGMCLRSKKITPTIYMLCHLIMKAMYLAPPLPPGTVLYRGYSNNLYVETHDLGFSSYSTSREMTQSFTQGVGKVIKYVVGEDEIVHGISFNFENGSSLYKEDEILIGPGMQATIIGNEEIIDTHGNSDINYIVKLKQILSENFFINHLDTKLDSVFYQVYRKAFDHILLYRFSRKTYWVLPNETYEHIKGILGSLPVTVLNSNAMISEHFPPQIYLNYLSGGLYIFSDIRFTQEIIVTSREGSIKIPIEEMFSLEYGTFTSIIAF